MLRHAGRHGGDQVGAAQQVGDIGGAGHLDHRVQAVPLRIQHHQEPRPEVAAIVHHDLRGLDIGLHVQRLARQRVGRVHDAGIAFLQQPAPVIAFVLDRDRTDQDIAFRPGQLIAAIDGRGDDPQPQAPRLLPGAMDHPGQDHDPFVKVAADDDIGAGRGRIEIARGDQRLEAVGQIDGLGDDFGTAFGRHDPRPLPHEQLVLENLAQPRDRVADRRLGQPKLIRRARETAMHMHRPQRAQRGKVQGERIA